MTRDDVLAKETYSMGGRAELVRGIWHRQLVAVTCASLGHNSDLGNCGGPISPQVCGCHC